MCFLVKQTKVYHIVVVYAVLLLNFIVLAQNRSTELDNKLNSTENQSFPLYLAMTIENATVLANLPGLEATKFGFLYLHGRSNHVQFDNEEVESELGSFVDKQGYSYPITFYPNETFSPQLPSMYNQSPSQNESQPQNTDDYQTPALQFVAKYQHSPQALAENESTPRSSDMRDDFHGQNLSQPQDILQEYNQSVSWQSAISTDFKSSPQNLYDAFNNNPIPTQELFQDSPASSLREQKSSQEEGLFTNTTQYNATQQEEYSRDYQHQEPLESTTLQQTSFENSASTIPYQNPLAPEQSFDRTINQNTTQESATQQQHYYSPVYQQQNYYNSVYQQQQQERREDTTPLQSVFKNSTADDPKFTSEQPKFMQQNLQLQQQEQTQQNITEAQQNSFLNSSETLQEQSDSFRQERNPIQGNYEERYLQKNINEQNSFKNVTTPQLTQSAREEKYIQGSESEESSVENATNSQSKQELRSFNPNETEKHSNITDKHSQKEMLFSEEQNKQNLPHENTTNTKYTEQNLYEIERDPHIIQSLLSRDLSQFRNEYELTAQKVKDTTTDTNTPSTQAGYQETYSRFRRENKGRNLFKRADVQQNVEKKQAKRVLGKHLQKLLEKNQAKTLGGNLHTNRLKRMTQPAHNESHSKPTIFDKLLNNPSETNFLMLPSTKPNYRHRKRSREHGLLMKLEAMRHTFLEKHNECPSYAIFGTNSESCFTLTTDKDNCAEEFMEVKEMFKQGCAQTLFYIYVREKEAGKVRVDDVQSLTKNGINVLIPK